MSSQFLLGHLLGEGSTERRVLTPRFSQVPGHRLPAVPFLSSLYYALILLVQLVLDMNPPTSPGASVFFFLIFIMLSDSSRIEAPEHSCLDGG